MSLFGKIRIVLDMGLQKSGRMIAGLLSLTFLLTFCGVLLYSIGTEYAYRISFSEGLSGEVSDLCHMWIEAPDYETEADIFNKIKAMPQVDKIGCVSESVTTLSWTDSLAEKQGNNIVREEEGFYYYHTSGDVMDIADITLADSIEESEYLPGATKVYLGYELRDVYSVGDVIEISPAKDFTMIYQIAGIIEQGCRMFDINVYLQNYESCNGSENMDYRAVFVDEAASISDIYLKIDSDKELTRTMSEIVGTAEKSGGRVEISSVDELIEFEQRESKRVVEQLLSIAMLLGATSVFLVVLTQLTQLYVRCDEFGIWYACGATLKDMTWVLVLQNILRWLIATILALFITFFVCKWWSDSNTVAVYQGYMLFWKVQLPGIVVTGSFFTMLSTIIPVVLFKNKMPVELLNGDS